MNIYNCCCLCLEEDKNDGDTLIWRDGMQLCESCYKTYTDNKYNKSIMPVNAIKIYRREIAENYISKDKIRDKINELEKEYKNGNIKKQRYYDARYLLKELLEE